MRRMLVSCLNYLWLINSTNNTCFRITCRKIEVSEKLMGSHSFSSIMGLKSKLIPIANVSLKEEKRSSSRDLTRIVKFSLNPSINHILQTPGLSMPCQQQSCFQMNISLHLA